MKSLQSRIGSGRLFLGYAAAMGAAMSYGASQTIGKHITTEFAPPLVGTAFALVFGFVYVSLMFHRHIPVDVKTNPRMGYLWFSLSGITSASGVALLYFALSEAPVVVISPVVAISPLVSLTLAHIFLQRVEKITLRTILGTLLVVLGVVIITLSRNAS